MMRGLLSRLYKEDLIMTLSPLSARGGQTPHFCHYLAPDAGKNHHHREGAVVRQAIQTAGTVRGRGSSQHAKSDWMEMENSVVFRLPPRDASSCITTAPVNLLDTLGHEDFSEDTCLPYADGGGLLPDG